MPSRRGITEQVYGWLVAANALSKFRDLREWDDTLVDHGNRKAGNHLAAGRWTLEDVVRDRVARVLIQGAKWREEMDHRREALASAGEFSDDPRKVLWQYAGVFDPSYGLRAHAAMASRNIAMDVFRLASYRNWRRTRSYDPARHGEAPDDDEVLEPIDPADVDALCERVTPVQAALVRVRYAHPTWLWPQVREELEAQGFTCNDPSKVLDRLADDHPVAELLQGTKKTPRDAARIADAKAYVAAAKERLATLAREAPLSWFALVALARGLGDEEASQTLLDDHELSVRKQDLVELRKAVLAQLAAEERRALLLIAREEDLDEMEEHLERAREAGVM
ncbi:hypothetical protein DVA67_020410 [Solirubrobacter sp. CPCC 204708]|uniref:Uncharacterized protein n=1 Tax=Solirubrobacter deserti TaxID=2282478 RepID=A0ABT4RNK0_9ACTN|nr:hypothetical protein [Solirubrobacter deserti]MBE2318356.1 hypothetical protein [Solirubrobacter deserti]MDA0140124.1 hypothetical protein [Solirubrobacter deserti]